MKDTENVFDGFALLGDDEEFDVDKIFGGGSDEPAPPPPAPTLAEEVKPQFDPEQVQTETARHFPQRRRKHRQKNKAPLWSFFRRSAPQKKHPARTKPRSAALCQDPKHNEPRTVCAGTASCGLYGNAVTSDALRPAQGKPQ